MCIKNESIIANHGGPFLPENRKLRVYTRISSSGTFQIANCAIAKLQLRANVIVRVRIVSAQRAAAGADHAAIAHQAQQQIQVMNALIRQHAAAVLLLAAPGAAGIVRFVSVPENANAAQQYLAEVPLLNRPPQSLRGRIIPVLHHARKLDAPVFTMNNQRFQRGDIQHHRLFAQDMLSAISRFPYHLPVAAAGSANADRIHLRVMKHLNVIRICLAAVLLCKRVRFLHLLITAGGEPRVFHLANGCGVRMGNAAAADQSVTNDPGHTAHPFFFSTRRMASSVYWLSSAG